MLYKFLMLIFNGLFCFRLYALILYVNLKKRQTHILYNIYHMDIKTSFKFRLPIFDFSCDS